MRIKLTQPSPPATPHLRQRWPDLQLGKYFHDLLAIYLRTLDAPAKKNAPAIIAMHAGYQTICQWIAATQTDEWKTDNGSAAAPATDRQALRALVLNLQRCYGPDWLQGLASLLGMLMHFRVSRSGSQTLINTRRPQRLYSTYPNSPMVSRFVSKTIMTRLFHQPIPTLCHRRADAERFAERALDFRILDPSMEAGQLLLEIGLACVGQVHRKHAVESKSARYLTQALLRKLCADCLWGVDQNERATHAVSLLFSLLGKAYGMERLELRHLITADTLAYFKQGRLPQFDGVVNNPPWGEELKATERQRMRDWFSTIEHWSDTYIAFSELAIRCLRPGGALGLILPSQVIGTRNAAQLRRLLLDHIELEQLIVLPRSSFADATVRGVILLGQSQSPPTAGACRVTLYPLEKRFDRAGAACSFTIPAAALRGMGEGSWTSLINDDAPVAFIARTVPLEQLATLSSGVKVYGKNSGSPPQTAGVVRQRPFTLSRPARGTVPAIRGRDMQDFQVGEPRQFIRFGKWLAWIGKHDSLRWSPRIFVRELCRRDGKITAAIGGKGVIPLHGVLTVVPQQIDLYALVGILNSTVAASYVRRHVASFSKVDFQKITLSELRRMPIPVAAIGSAYRSALGLKPPTRREAQLHQRLTLLTRKLSRAKSLSGAAREKLRAEMDAIVWAMYGPRKERSHA